MIAIIVDFVALDGKGDEVSEVLQTQAKNSLEKEHGCKHFDVCRDPEDANRFFLYELYDDAAAVDAHGKTEHYVAFRARLDPLLESRNRREMTRL